MDTKIFAILLSIIALYSCKKNTNIIGDQTITVFDKTHLYFDLSLKANPEDSIIRTDAGRVLLKKVKLPTYNQQPKALAEITLTSKGDPWDKSGSLFIIPKNTDISLLDMENGSFDKKELTQSYPAVQLFSNDSVSYQPNIELIRFMTPFGVGHFTNNERVKDRKPIYIPKWEEKASWSQDITHLLPLMEGEVYIGIYIDTWTKEGYEVSVSLTFEESAIPNHLKQDLKVLPIINTVKYAAKQRFYDGFSDKGLIANFTTKNSYKNAKLYYITTGHGGHAQGDEFVKKENIISFDQNVIKQFIPWRDDCASFRRFNPTSGTWRRDRILSDSTIIKETIASSDLSRSNWCPGSMVVPEIIELGTLEAGIHNLKIEIPEAQPAIENEINYWMVSAYLVYEVE